MRQMSLIVVDFVTGSGIAFVLWFGGNMVVKGPLTPGDFASIIVLFI